MDWELLREGDHRLQGSDRLEARPGVGSDSWRVVEAKEFLDQEADAHENAVISNENALEVSP